MTRDKPAPYRTAQPDGSNPTAGNPISPDGVPQPGQDYLIPARQGRAMRLKRGQSLTIINPQGHQVCDFFAITEDSPAEFLSMEHCRTALGRITVKTGDRLVTNRRRALIEITEDSSPGVHDILIAACDHTRYQQLGCRDYHDNCADNFRMSLAAIGVTPLHVPCPFNIWMNVPVVQGGAFDWAAPVSKPDDYVVLQALEDCIAVMSACPQDMTSVNGVGTAPAELVFRIGR
ncbi:urea carboxylase-associated family protein [Pelagibius sp. Alg239-R121]|uniref:urea carboxylase-associated family protein n=1 Tax=Pelagibius sp. Alg239-R121 TaxID=2993448 RepID=UPI0024A6657F|nr:urea carboxylase-associated family protein [Pelagibius sp. Alg239-R121]